MQIITHTNTNLNEVNSFRNGIHWAFWLLLKSSSLTPNIEYKGPIPPCVYFMAHSIYLDFFLFLWEYSINVLFLISPSYWYPKTNLDHHSTSSYTTIMDKDSWPRSLVCARKLLKWVTMVYGYIFNCLLPFHYLHNRKRNLVSHVYQFSW